MKNKGWNLAVTALGCILIGALLGCVTNLLDTLVSPVYFRTVMGWNDLKGLTGAIAAQGIFEGTLFGVVFAVIFTAVVGIASKAEASLAYIFRFILVVGIVVLGCWALGGLIAMMLAGLSPEFYRRTFVGVPEKTAPMLRYAWVGGSIWGIEIGSVLSAILGSVVFGIRWKERTKGKAGGKGHVRG